MCYQARTLQSGANISSKRVAHTYETRITAGRRSISRTREGEAIVPMASVIDTSGASSAAEVFRSKQATESWRRQRPLSESEYQEYQSMPSGVQNVQARFGPITSASGRRAAAWGTAQASGGNNRGMVAQPLLIAPPSYDEYLEATQRPAPSSRPSRLGIGGGARSTGLGY